MPSSSYFLLDVFSKGQTCIFNSLLKFPFGRLSQMPHSQFIHNWAHNLCAGNTSTYSSLAQCHIYLSHPRLSSLSIYLINPSGIWLNVLLPPPGLLHLLTGHQSIHCTVTTVIFFKSKSDLLTLIPEMFLLFLFHNFIFKLISY